MYGSAFYSVEKDAKGYPELYKVTDDFFGYKITEKTTVDEIFEKVAKYEKKNSELTESKKRLFSKRTGLFMLIYSECEFIGGFDKFWGDVIAREGTVG
mgnify:FL=1